MINLFSLLRRWILLILLLSICAGFFYFKLYNYLHFDSLKRYILTIQQSTQQHYKTAVALYILLFTLLIACGIPVATVLCLLGGLLFGAIAILYAVFATALGGLILCVAVRMAIGAGFTHTPKSWLGQVEAGIREDAFNYLLMLRLIPIFPCWISNIAAGLLKIPLKTFLLATIIGITPATVIYVLAGRSLDKLLLADESAILNLVFTPSVFFPLIGLAILSVFPVIYKHVKRRYDRRD